VAMIGKVRTWLTLLDTDLAERSRVLADQGKGMGPEAAMSNKGRRSKRETKRTVKRAVAVAKSPPLRKAMAAGDFSDDHADALRIAKDRLASDEAKARFAANEQRLVESSRKLSADDFAAKAEREAELCNDDDGIGELNKQRLASSGSHWRDRVSRMYKLFLEIDSERGAHIESAVRKEVNRLWRLSNTGAPPANKLESLTADAIYNLITNAEGTRSGTSGIDISVLIDLRTLIGGLRPGSVSETEHGIPLPPETIRRYACDNNIIPAVLDSRGVVLDLGRSARLASLNQRRALRAMYPGCADNDCDTPFTHCQIHHLIAWTADQGPTDMANLVPVCSQLHHKLHEGGWKATLDADRTLRLYQPDGTLHSTNPLPAPPDAAARSGDGTSGQRAPRRQPVDPNSQPASRHDRADSGHTSTAQQTSTSTSTSRPAAAGLRQRPTPAQRKEAGQKGRIVGQPSQTAQPADPAPPDDESAGYLFGDLRERIRASQLRKTKIPSSSPSGQRSCHAHDGPPAEKAQPPDTPLATRARAAIRNAQPRNAQPRTGPPA